MAVVAPRVGMAAGVARMICENPFSFWGRVFCVCMVASGRVGSEGTRGGVCYVPRLAGAGSVVRYILRSACGAGRRDVPVAAGCLFAESVPIAGLAREEGGGLCGIGR